MTQAVDIAENVAQSGKELADFIQQHPKLWVITGAGVSTDSGIPDYRDALGQWKRPPPVQHGDFMTFHGVRQRYWARALIGFRALREAQTSGAHRALAALEAQGYIQQLVTQNVDRLHQRAGSRRVIDLHGRADMVKCMACDYQMMRHAMHAEMARMNPTFADLQAGYAPDGDADLETDFSAFRIFDCPRCRGILKPDVVFYGDVVPAERRLAAQVAMAKADAVLAVGTSLMVFSGYRFCRAAHERGMPLASLSLGVTRADALLTHQWRAPLTPVLEQAVRCLQPTLSAGAR
ncbi:NAD-dependent protein deacetylase [Halomonas sp. FME1]|uniref:protein acetyllysine N-acetyltransferase n=1 Tax=Halomonas casei TaxID=2742613 RepID=A0ABR9F1A0_9GAMM|nr:MULTISPECIES: NAD-dependent protein deacetylase [Halomonas]MBE0399904.1 NAD-dependent protein deacetylase [Halomonas casei]PCC23542.1 NAD-dependent deacetylase [Halomonas sp. JB37]